MKKHLSCILLLLVTLTAPIPGNARTYSVKDVPNVQVADRTRFVTDPDNVLGTTATRNIDRMLAQVRDSNTVEVAVVVLPSIGDYDTDLFATDLFTEWGIGQQSNSNGLLILAVMDSRRVVFRTGYGIEGVLPDIVCKRIIDRCIIPAFKQGDYGTGMEQAVSMVAQIVTHPENADELTATPADEDKDGPFTLAMLLAFYLACSILASVIISFRIARTGKQYKDTPYECYKRYNSMLPMLQITAIFFPIWGVANLSRCRKRMTALRDAPRNCEKCGAPMHKLDEHADNAYLTPQEDVEEQIGSVDYDVWVCDRCDNIDVYRFETPYTRYTECPHCHSKAYSLTRDHIVRPASTLAAGMGEKIYVCSYCKLRTVEPYIIPMIIVPPPTGKGGGFGGGSIGGGFGGGMTGGGGAGGSW